VEDRLLPLKQTVRHPRQCDSHRSDVPARGSDVVLDNGVGEPLAPWTASADFRRIVSELELPRTRFHDLRHARATQLLAAGVHPKAVSERLGHSSVAFTMDTYLAHIPTMGRAAADAADQLFRLTAK
jgi:integrase